MIHDHYREHLNAGIDEKCLILLGKLFCAVMTLKVARTGTGYDFGCPSAKLTQSYSLWPSKLSSNKTAHKKSSPRVYAPHCGLVPFPDL